MNNPSYVAFDDKSLYYNVTTEEKMRMAKGLRRLLRPGPCG